MRKWVIILACILALFVLVCLGLDMPPVIIVGYLLVAWAQFLYRVVPQIQISWGGMLTGVLALAGTLWLTQVLGRWLFREVSGKSWRFGWTLAATLLIVLMFTAGIGAVGVTHQTAWIARSPEPMFGYYGGVREGANRVKCASNLRQIGHAIMLYANENQGRYPDHFEAILLTQDITSELFVCPSSNEERAAGDTAKEIASRLSHGHCSYVYHGRGLTTAAPATRPIACEPLANHQGAGINILFADGHVEWFTPSEAQKVMMRLGQ